MQRFALNDLRDRTVDVAIIGGGITGASAAREAALRGLSVVLLEQNDFASGTSSRSTKLLHGGLRYLESHEFKLVREACRERELMLKLAPHLTHVRPFIYLLYQGYPEGMRLLNVGLTIYDLFSGSPLKRRHHMLSASTVIDKEPHIRREGLVGGGWYYDVLTDDARITIETVKSASDAGAYVGNHMEVTGFVWERERISGVEVVDRIRGERGPVHARQVINAAGIWVDRVRFLEPSVTSRLMRPTKGVHMVVRKRDFPLNHAVFLRSPRDQRLVWPIPALDDDLVYIGTTDTDYDGPLDHVTATRDDIEYLLEVANEAIPESHLGYEHIVSTWAGLRPLIKPEGELAASAVSREHQIFTSPGGLLTIAGGKFTTARVMGVQVIEAAIRLLNTHHGVKDVPRSRSHQIQLSGGDPGALFRARQQLNELPIPTAIRERWLALYGGNAVKLVDIARSDPQMAEDLGESHLTRAEVCYAVEDEMALSVADFFARRASVFYWLSDGGLSVAEPVAQEMGQILGWSMTEQQQQVQNYRDWVEANRLAASAIGH